MDQTANDTNQIKEETPSQTPPLSASPDSTPAAPQNQSTDAIPPAQPLIVSNVTDSVAEKTPTSTPASELKKSNKSPLDGGLKIGIGIALVLVILFGFSIAAAYGMVSIGKGAAQTALANFIIGLPFMPKTPNYVLTQSLEEHQKVTKFTFDASLASSSTDISKLFGVGNLDMEIKGPVDYSNPDNPMASVHAQITKDFSSDLKVKDHIVYFKLNQFPDFLSAFFTLFGFPPGIEDKFINQWFYIDTTPLNTEAQANLKQQESTDTPQEEMKKAIAILDDPAVEKSITMSSASLDSYPVYDVHFTPDSATFNSVTQKLSAVSGNTAANRTLYTDSTKPSDYIEHFVMDTWIDKQNYVVRKIALSFTLKSPMSQNSSYGYMLTMPTQNQKYPVSFVIHFTDFEKPITVDTPKGALKFDEFFKTVVEQAATQSANQKGLFPGSQLPQTLSPNISSNNAKRRSDVNAIVMAIYKYKVDHGGSLPAGITTTKLQIKKYSGADLCSALIPKYLTELPVDPSINSGTQISNCASNYSTGYYVIKDATSRVTVSAPSADKHEEIKGSM